MSKALLSSSTADPAAQRCHQNLLLPRALCGLHFLRVMARTAAGSSKPGASLTVSAVQAGSEFSDWFRPDHVFNPEPITVARWMMSSDWLDLGHACTQEIEGPRCGIEEQGNGNEGGSTLQSNAQQVKNTDLLPDSLTICLLVHSRDHKSPGKLLGKSSLLGGPRCWTGKDWMPFSFGAGVL